MSNAFAIAAVTYVLKNRLVNAISGLDIGDTRVSSLPPDRVVIGDQELNQLNLFLYRVTPNQGWRNAGLPARNDRSERISNPPLALDLHYLLTAYGNEELYSDVLMGHALQMLHESPVLSRKVISGALQNTDQLQNSLSTTNLAEQIEQIKLSPETFGAEEISKLWSAFGTKYRPSTAFQASVVLIESESSVKSALPVRERKVSVIPFQQALIEAVSSTAKPSEDPRLTTQSTLVIKGRQLKGQNTRVRIGEVEVTVLPQDVTSSEIRVGLERFEGLHAGAHTVKVAYELPDTHFSAESNAASFVLSPIITNPPSFTDKGLEISFSPRVGKKQRLKLFLNEIEHPKDKKSQAYSFAAPKDNGITSDELTETESVVFAINNVSPGKYLVRVQVDGVESLLNRNDRGEYDWPQVTIR